MKIINKDVTRQFRRRACELCGYRYEVCGHHIIAAGIGGANRIDHPLNLVALCLVHHDWIHTRGGIKVPTQQDLWRLVAKRERVAFKDIEPALRCVERLPRDARPHHLDRACEGLTDRQRELVLGIIGGRE